MEAANNGSEVARLSLQKASNADLNVEESTISPYLPEIFGEKEMALVDAELLVGADGNSTVVRFVI